MTAQGSGQRLHHRSSSGREPFCKAGALRCWQGAPVFQTFSRDEYLRENGKELGKAGGCEGWARVSCLQSKAYAGVLVETGGHRQSPRSPLCIPSRGRECGWGALWEAWRGCGWGMDLSEEPRKFSQLHCQQLVCSALLLLFILLFNLH